MSTTKENIINHGWESIYVFDENEVKQAFLYSIGLTETFKHPELIIFGLPRETMHGILSDIVEDIKQGTVFEKDKRVSNIISSEFDVMFKEMKEQYFDEYLGAAKRYYQKPFKTWVMFWPDKNNILPTDASCEIDLQDEALKIV